MTEEKHLERMELIVIDDDFALAEAFVAKHFVYGWEEESLPTGGTRITMHSEDTTSCEALAEDLQAFLPHIDMIRSTIVYNDWTNAWKDFFTPVQADDFLVIPPWLADDKSLLPHEHSIIIEPKSAFGTGHHASTVLCLKAISTIRAQGKIQAGQRFLDLGMGTGILGIACTKYGLSGHGLDIDTLAVSNAKENCDLNNVSNFSLDLGSIDMVAGQQFDLVIANILAAPLRDMAVDIMNCVKPGGVLLLSGFLGIQCADLEKAYAKLGTARGIRQETDMKDGEWVCLYWT